MANQESDTKLIDDFKKDASQKLNQLLQSSIGNAASSAQQNLAAAEDVANSILGNIKAGSDQNSATYSVFKNTETGVHVTLRNVDREDVEGIKFCYGPASFEACTGYVNAHLTDMVALAKDDSKEVLKKAEANSTIRRLIEEFLEDTTKG
ncbi:hypothetical protein MLD52_14780 [Puniceicoccaceae bacterium K14]|nr:hypothetical protein [Puniceicoccaceae bacterium K14]